MRVLSPLYTACAVTMLTVTPGCSDSGGSTNGEADAGASGSSHTAGANSGGQAASGADEPGIAGTDGGAPSVHTGGRGTNSGGRGASGAGEPGIAGSDGNAAGGDNGGAASTGGGGVGGGEGMGGDTAGASSTGEGGGSAVGGRHDVPDWVEAMPTLDNGLPWDPGIPGDIPTGSLDTTLADDQMTAEAINAALEDASRRGSPTNIRVVQMPAGTFDIAGIVTPQNYTILRGAGPWGSGRTRLNFDADGGVASGWPSYPAAVDVVLASGSNVPAGSTQVTVTDASSFTVGDVVQIDQLDDLSYVAILDGGYDKRAPYPGDYNGPQSPDGFRSVASLHQVTAINGTTLTFEPPARMRFDEAFQPQAWRVARRDEHGLWWFGLEDVSIAGPQNGAIAYREGAYNWVQNVETDGSQDGGISDNHIAFSHEFRSEMRRVYAHHTTGGPYSGGANYGLTLNAATSESLIIDSIVVFMNKLIQTNAAGPGNVIAYCYADNTSANGGDWMDGAINGSHQSFTHHLLVEGNWAANMGCDTTHGNSGRMAFVRNYTHGRNSTYESSGNLRAANSDGWQREMAFVGNVLMSEPGARYESTGAYEGGAAIWRIGQMVWGSGDQYDGQTTRPPQNDMQYDGAAWDSRQATFTTKALDMLWRHGNWDSVTNDVVWDPSLGAHALPNSLFLATAPGFFGTTRWPWVDPTGATATARVAALPAKARYDAGTPFAR